MCRKKIVRKISKFYLSVELLKKYVMHRIATRAGIKKIYIYNAFYTQYVA